MIDGGGAEIWILSIKNTNIVIIHPDPATVVILPQEFSRGDPPPRRHHHHHVAIISNGGKSRVEDRVEI